MDAPITTIRRRFAAHIARLSPAQAKQCLDAIRAEGVTINHPTIRQLTGGFASQSLNTAVVRRLAERAGIIAAIRAELPALIAARKIRPSTRIAIEPKRNRVAEVNREIKAAGGSEKLTRGRGYYYFRDGDAPAWRESSVYIFRSEDLSVEEWLAEYHRCAATSWTPRAFPVCDSNGARI